MALPAALTHQTDFCILQQHEHVVNSLTKLTKSEIKYTYSDAGNTDLWTNAKESTLLMIGIIL